MDPLRCKNIPVPYKGFSTTPARYICLGFKSVPLDLGTWTFRDCVQKTFWVRGGGNHAA